MSGHYFSIWFEELQASFQDVVLVCLQSCFSCHIFLDHDGGYALAFWHMNLLIHVRQGHALCKTVLHQYILSYGSRFFVCVWLANPPQSHCESGHPCLLAMLLHFKHWSLSPSNNGVEHGTVPK